MKRSVLLLIPLVVGLASCGGNSPAPSTDSGTEVISNQETVNKVKEILDKQDLSEFYSKTLQGTYTQEYDVLDINNDYDFENFNDDEEPKTSSYFNYGGYGVFGYYYDLSEDQYNSIVDEKGNVDTFDAIATGTGSYGISQLSRAMSFNREGNTEATIYNLDISQTLMLKTTKQDVWVENSLDVTDKGVFDGDATQRFKASIDKELLFSSISTRVFRELFSKVDLFDTTGNIEHLDKLYISICRELVAKSDKEISDFLLENQVSIQEEEENIKLSFVFSTEDIEEEEADYIFPGAIKGTLSFGKETYQMSDFDYGMTYRMETYDEETGSVKLVNTKFACQGVSYRGLPDDPWEPRDPIVYDDVLEFLKDVNEQVVPPKINL